MAAATAAEPFEGVNDSLHFDLKSKSLGRKHVNGMPGPAFFYVVKASVSCACVVCSFVRVLDRPRSCWVRPSLRLPPHQLCGVDRPWSEGQDATRIPVVDIVDILVKRVDAWKVHEEHALRITHGFPVHGLPRVPCAQVNLCSASAEFWYDPEEGHIEVAHQDLHLERTDLA